ncbi:MAG TPA: helix-turn-helix transcriptional regulator, partial [Kofleriaceae bacterium]
FVEDVYLLAPAPGAWLPVEWLPDGRTHLVIRELENGRGDACVVGPRTRAIFKRATGVRRAMRLRFKAGWSAPLFGVPAHELVDRFVSIDELWGRGLTAELLAARDASEVLARDIVDRDAFESASARLARRAARLLEHDAIRVDRVAEQLGVTARHLRRVFAEHIGIGPKDYARTVRLQRAVRGAIASSDWTRIARDAGYYDQAHLIGEFRELLGFTPGAYAARFEPTRRRA